MDEDDMDIIDDANAGLVDADDLMGFSVWESEEAYLMHQEIEQEDLSAALAEFEASLALEDDDWN